MRRRIAPHQLLVLDKAARTWSWLLTWN